jgi:hypothetical protein
MNPIHGDLIYDPVFHTYVDIRSARGQRLYATYAHVHAARHAAGHAAGHASHITRKRDSRNAAAGDKDSKRKR